jgi:hypothetical protein
MVELTSLSMLVRWKTICCNNESDALAHASQSRCHLHDFLSDFTNVTSQGSRTIGADSAHLLDYILGLKVVIDASFISTQGNGEFSHHTCLSRGIQESEACRGLNERGKTHVILDGGANLFPAGAVYDTKVSTRVFNDAMAVRLLHAARVIDDPDAQSKRFLDIFQ